MLNMFLQKLLKFNRSNGELKAHTTPFWIPVTIREASISKVREKVKALALGLTDQSILAIGRMVCDMAKVFIVYLTEQHLMAIG